MSRSRAGAVLGAILALSALGPAQEPESRPATRPGKLKAEITYIDAGTWYLIENVRILYGDLDVHCDSAIVWWAKEDQSPLAAIADAPETRRGEIAVGLGRRINEIYVEGHVLLRQGEEVHYCDSAFFDLVHERGIIVDPESRLPFPTSTGQKATLSLKADELRVLSQYQIEGVGVRVSSCPFGNPHYHVASDKVEIYRARARERTQPSTGGPETPSFYYTATGNALFVGSSRFPALWIPDIAGDSATPEGQTLRYVKGAHFGHSSQFGWEYGLELGDNLVTEKGEKWGAWLLDLHYLSKRGAGIGIDFAYEKPGYRGQIRTNYQRDVGKDEFFGEPPTDNRGRFSIRHRTWLQHDVQLDLELNWFSDRGYYPTYFEDEQKQDKPPETYAYAKRAFQNSAVTGLFSTRINDFETVTEYKPRLEYLLLTEPIACFLDNPLYFTMSAEVSRLRQVFDNDLDLDTISNVRADVDTLLEYSTQAGPVKITPFLGLRSTYYEHDIFRNNDRARTGFTWGAEASTRLWRNYDVAGGIFDLDGLRHVIEPAIEYRRTTGVELQPDELFVFDPVDGFDDVESVTFELRNLFQTVRHNKGKPARVDEIFDLDLFMTYYPDARADNQGDSWSPLFGKSVLRISDDFQVLSEFDWNPHGHGLERFDIGLGYTPSPEFQAYAGLRHFDDVYDTIYGQVNWRMSEKWLVRAYSAYDINRGEGSEYDFVLNRIGHDWVFSVILHADIGEDDYAVSFGLEPKIFFDPVLRPTGRRREPEFQYLGSWVDR